MEFKKYQHVERYGTTETEDINIGKCYIFPKIDGTNSSVWLNENGEVRAGSRNRELTLENDNQGFDAMAVRDERIVNYLKQHPTHRLYGEWLVPHSLKTYKDNAWRKFYIFDVTVDNPENTDGVDYLPYNEYKPLLDKYGLDYILCLKVVVNGDYDDFVRELDNNNFLIKDGMGTGEGIVIKNYDYRNWHGRQTWAKIITSEFKEKHIKAMGTAVKECSPIEKQIADEYITSAFVEKEYAKLIEKNNGWTSGMIPEFLNRVWYEFISEEMWNTIKKFRNPTIDFKVLHSFVTKKIKEVKTDIF